ncbi:unnamed protein product [Sphacelaria rigidula]
MTRVWPPTLLWTLLCWSYCTRLAPRVAGQEQQPKPKPRVAVVGAGIGGSSAAFFLRESVGEDVDIVVFDKAEKPGGRTDVRNIFYFSCLYAWRAPFVWSAFRSMCSTPGRS